MATQLHAAAIAGNEAIASALQRTGAPVNAADSDGTLGAITECVRARIYVLTIYKTCTSCPVLPGMTPLAAAVCNDRLGMVRLLLRTGASARCDAPQCSSDG